MRNFLCITILIFIVISSTILAAERVSLGFLYGVSDSIELVKRTNGSMNEIAPTYFNLDKKGNLVLSDGLDEEFIAEMKKDGIKVTPFLSNHWSRSKGRAALRNKEELVNQIVEVILKYNFDGINIDIENLTPKDKDNFTEFIKLLREKLPEEKALTVSVAANPHASEVNWQGSYDYAALGKLADYLFVMTYDEHSYGGKCGPVASAEFVELSIQYALQHVDKNKIVIGIPLYGRFWREESDIGGEAIVIGDMPRILSKFNAKTEYDEKYQTAKVTFHVTSHSKVKVNGTRLEKGNYTIWYENEESIKYKLYLVNKYNLRGAGVWALGQEKVDVWEYYSDALNEAFNDAEEIKIHEAYKMIQAVSKKLEVAVNVERVDSICKKFDINDFEMKAFIVELPPKKRELVVYEEIKESLDYKYKNKMKEYITNKSKSFYGYRCT